jgi:hypothetical protein
MIVQITIISLMIVHESHNPLIVRSASLINDCFSHPKNQCKLSTIRVQGRNYINTVRAHPLGSAMTPHISGATHAE